MKKKWSTECPKCHKRIKHFGDHETEFDDDKLRGRYAKVGDIYNKSDVKIIVSGAGSCPSYIFEINDIIVNTRTGEAMKVLGTPFPGTILVNRSIDITPAIAYVPACSGIEGDELCIIGTDNKNHDNLLVFVDKNIFNK